ncbi:hypothetical protein NMY22_g10403 [Coprinellus aureogranulatus]|nr:hypothetical protein NMY22_g10403 [Coprinellus aureogranulatus]
MLATSPLPTAFVKQCRDVVRCLYHLFPLSNNAETPSGAPTTPHLIAMALGRLTMSLSPLTFVQQPGEAVRRPHHASPLPNDPGTSNNIPSPLSSVKQCGNA